ncbi:MAG: phosphotriesterase family protein [Streptosporangiaceae bacterium]
MEGDIPASDFGIVLPHEHVVCDSSVWLDTETAAAWPQMSKAEPALDNLWWMRQFPNSNPSALRLDSDERASAELAAFRRLGGTAVVDLTTAGLGRDVAALRSIARESGVRIISGTGLYIGPSHPDWARSASVDELAAYMAGEITDGVRNTGICCGVIGEMGVSHPVLPAEERALRAATRAQQRTGAAISVHTAAHAVDADSALAVADILEDEGAEMSRVVMGHMDAVLHRPDYLRAALNRGCMIEFDLFGHEFFESENSFQSFGDTEKCRATAALVAEGWTAQLLLSHDICYKIQLQAYGGYGYAHLLRNIAPRLRLLGVDDDDLEQLMIHNPRRVFSMPAAEPDPAVEARAMEAGR